MRRLVPILIACAAFTVGTLIIPGGRASAEKAAPVEVTNVPLPVTVGNFPATQSVAGIVGATQSGVWSVKLTTPGPFAGSDDLQLPPTFFSRFCEGGNFTAPAGAVIETISVLATIPAGETPRFGLCVPGAGTVWVPLQFQGTDGNGVTTYYVGTVTNSHIPIGTGSAQPVLFTFARTSDSGPADARVTVTGTPGS